MCKEEKIFEVNDKDMQKLIEYIKEALDAADGDKLLVVDNFWRVTIAKII